MWKWKWGKLPTPAVILTGANHIQITMPNCMCQAPNVGSSEMGSIWDPTQMDTLPWGRAGGWLAYQVESDGLKQYAFPSDRFITGIPCCVSKICDTVISLPRETPQKWVLGVF